MVGGLADTRLIVVLTVEPPLLAVLTGVGAANEFWMGVDAMSAELSAVDGSDPLITALVSSVLARTFRVSAMKDSKCSFTPLIEPRSIVPMNIIVQ